MRTLEPLCQISYLRMARIGETEHGSCRLTLDSGMRALPTGSPRFVDSVHAVPLLENRWILELKYRYSLPALFKRLLSELAPVSHRVWRIRTFISTRRALNSPLLNAFTTPLVSAAVTSPWAVLLRLLVALLLGCGVAGIYLKTAKHGESGPSFPITLVLLAVLIAMVTQVVGNNVALAFSLVGALSVVRFRTVVRDTRDTAYVIFAVVVGMAVGAANLWVAVLGILVIGGASFFALKHGVGNDGSVFLLTLRIALGRDLEAVAGDALNRFLAAKELIGIATAKQGLGIEYTLQVTPTPQGSMEQLVKALNLIEGVSDVRFERRDLI